MEMVPGSLSMSQQNHLQSTDNTAHASFDARSPLGPEYDEYLQAYDDSKCLDSSKTWPRSTANEISPGNNHLDPLISGNRRPAMSSTWWWTEIASVVTSIAAMVALVVVLAVSDGWTLSRWTFFFQPNTIISILIMIGKASMMTAVGSCLGQLKWKHFQDRPQPLSHLQIFDDASRGPLGSIILMGKGLRVGAFLAFFLAVVTTASVAIDPTAQQILEFPSRTAKLDNVTANIGLAKQYTSAAYTNKYPDADASNFYIELYNGDTLTLQSSILNAIFGTLAEPSYFCPPPATSCSWPDFSTIGVCGSFRNLTDISVPTCNTSTSSNDNQESLNLSCEYDYTGRNRSEVLVNMVWNLVAKETANGDTVVSPTDYTWYQSATTIHMDAFGDYSFSMTSVRVVNANNGIGANNTPPATEMLQSNWYLCERSYHGAAVKSGSFMAGTLVSSALTPLQNTTVPANATAGGTLMSESFVTYRANSTGNEYTVGNYPFQRLYQFLQTTLDNRFGLFDNASTLDFGSVNILPMGYYLNLTDLAAMTSNIAEGITAQMRNTLPVGDNGNLTLFEGDAFIAETYIRVRWPWVILALLEVVVAALLLIATILVTRGQPLLKSSVMALLVHGLDGWDVGEAKAGRLDTEKDLERRSRSMTAVFGLDDNGWLRFTRTS